MIEATAIVADPVTRPLLRYFGGKWRLAPWIISHFPEHHTYVEPFGGAASVLLRKEPARFEVYNDLDSEVVTFFRMMRERPQDLVRLLRNTLYSREEYIDSYREDQKIDDMELARRFFVRAWQGYGGPRKKSLTGWKAQSRVWHSGRADQITEWNKAKQVMAAARRFRKVQIEQRDGLKVICQFDTPGTLFYVDPPYPAQTRNRRWIHRVYSCEMNPHDHTHLANLLNKIEGLAIVSTYPSELYDSLYAGWTRVSKTAQTMNKTIGIEVLYLHPRIAHEG